MSEKHNLDILPIILLSLPYLNFIRSSKTDHFISDEVMMVAVWKIAFLFSCLNHITHGTHIRWYSEIGALVLREIINF